MVGGCALRGSECPPTSHSRVAEPAPQRVSRAAPFARAAAAAGPDAPFATASCPLWRCGRALQLRALFRNIAQHDELFFAEFDELVDLPLAIGNPREQPFGGDHGFQVAACGGSAGLPVRPRAGSSRGAGAQTVGEGVEADGRFTLGGLGTCGMLSILPIGLLVLL